MNWLCRLLRAVLMGASLMLAPSLATPAVAQTWTEITPAGGPTGIELHGYGSTNIAHYDQASNRLIVFLPRSYGFGEPGISPDQTSDIWILTNANGLGGAPAWMKLATSGTPPAIHNTPSVIYDAAVNRLIVYGGGFFHTSPALNGVFVLTNANGLGGTPVWTQVSVTNPQARLDHSAVYDSQGNRMIAFGGHFAFWGTDQNDTRVLINADGTGGPSTWTTLSPSGPAPGARGQHTAIYDRTNNRMTIFGGQHLVSNSPCCTLPQYNDAWVLSNANGLGGTPSWIQQTPTGDPPPPRAYHSAVYDPVNNRMIVFGGGIWNQAAQAHTLLNDLWQLSNANGLGGTSTWTQLSQSGASPGPNFDHGAAFDAANQRMIVFGGINESGYHSRVWVLDFRPTTCVAPPAGMVSWWTGDGTASDIQGTSNGTLQGGAGYKPGVVDQAFALDGVNDFVQVPDHSSWHFGTGDFTIDLWVRFRSLKIDNPLVSNDEGPGSRNKWIFWVTSNNLNFDINTSTGDSSGVSAPFVPVSNTWYHVAVTKSGPIYTFYMNGHAIGSATNLQIIPDADASLNIGEAEGQYHTDGLIDEVEIFNRALTDLEIQAIYNAGSAGNCRPANHAPTACAGPDQTIEATGPAGAAVLLSGSGTDPDADTISYSWSEGDAPLGIGQMISPTLSLGQHTVTLTVSDGKGSMSTDIVVINVVDTTLPIASSNFSPAPNGNGWNKTKPLTVTLSGSDGGSGIKELRYCVNNGNMVIVAGSSATVTINTEGIFTINVHAIDNAGNVSALESSVIRIDESQPSVTCPAATTSAANSTCQAAIPNVAGSVTASDNLTSVVSLVITQSPAAGTLVGTGPHSIAVTVTDLAGNSRTCATTFTVIDNTAPTINCPANVSAAAALGQVSAVVTFSNLIVTDNCSGVTTACAPPSGSTFPLGITTVTCTATDASGNHASCSFKVAVSGTLLVNIDSFLRDGADNTNEGANERLRIQSSGHNRVLVKFNVSGIPTAGLQSATLVLNIAENSDNWGATGRPVDVHRLLTDWTEGSGRNDVMAGAGPGFRGTGEGVTWKCAKDSNINNQNDDCTTPWNGGTFAAATAPSNTHMKDQTGDVSWDVTADVLAGANYGWLIKKQVEGQNGQVRYYSREGAALTGNPNLTPRLVLVYNP